MKVIFMGTPDFAVASLRYLADNHDVTAVITQPDRPKGRGKKLLAPPVKDEALLRGIPVLQPEKIKDPVFFESLSQLEADIIVVTAYGQILPERILKLPTFGCINVHASLLPKLRGAAPIQWAIMGGESETGVTIQHMEKGIDTGDMILKKMIPILPGDTFGSLHDKLMPLGAEALAEAMHAIECGQAGREKQDNDLATYAPLITRQTPHIQWEKSSAEIDRLIRGLHPTPGTYLFFEQNKIRIFPGEIVYGYKNGDAGEIIDILPQKGLVIKTGDSAYLITELQPAGGKRMRTADYLRGHRMDLHTMIN